MRRKVELLVQALDRLITIDRPEYFTDYMQGYAQGSLDGLKHSLKIVREELVDYLDCPCGNPAVGTDVLGSSICASCQALEAQALEELAAGDRR